MEKFDAAIATHRHNIEHWKKEMSKIKLHSTEVNPTPELKVLSDEELEVIRPDTFKNSISKMEVELAKLSPNLQVNLLFSLTFLIDFKSLGFHFDLITI